MKNYVFKQVSLLLFFYLVHNYCFSQCNTSYPNTSVAYRTMLSGPDNTPLVYMCPQDILYINAPNAQGRAFTQFGAGNGANYKKPIILVEGLDLDIVGNGDQGDRIGDRGWPNFIAHTSNERDIYDPILDKLAILLPALNNAGYDFIYLDFNQGAAKMQDNSMVLVELIKTINARKVGGDAIRVIGTSMGGQIAKYALSYMEKNDMKHCVNEYISFDSPHFGANIPVSLQVFVNQMQNVHPKIKDLKDKLNLPAAKQLLIHHINGPNFGADVLRTEWLNDLNAVGNFPTRTRNVAVANGSNNNTELFLADSKFMNIKLSVPNTTCPFVDNAFLESDLWSIDNSVLYSGKRPNGIDWAGMVWNFSACRAACFGCMVTPDMFNDNQTLPYRSSWFPKKVDNAPGSTRPTIKQFGDEIRKGLQARVGDFGEAIGSALVNVYKDEHCFMPTISALNIYTSNLNFNINALIDNPDKPDPGYHPFEAFYAPTGNETHVEFTDGNNTWVINELAKTESKLAYVNFNLTNSAPNSGVYNFARQENRFIRTMIVGNGGKLLVNNNTVSDFGPSYTPGPIPSNLTAPIFYAPPTPGTTYTLETCYCENVIVQVGNNGEFTIGDINNINYNNKALVLFHDGSKLFIKSGGKLTIRKGSKLIMEKNTMLTLEQGGQIIIEQGAELVMQSNTQFIAAGLITLNGGKITQEPSSTLDLMSTSKLVVNNNSQVIIQTQTGAGGINTNAVLTYNQGAEIQLKGDNAVLELNGRLHIGNNATFSFTYPGSNSGYIKFNRGADVWWDNWATNNAHISCGTNAKIQLTGQSKTDKIIDISQINVAIPKNLKLFTMNKCLVEFNVGGARLETDRTTFINNSTFKGNKFDGYGDPQTRGLLMFGQQYFTANNCDFIDLYSGLTGALFYGGTRLSGVKNCNFTQCKLAIVIVGGGYSIINNKFLDNEAAIAGFDNIYNSLIKYNEVNSTSGPNTIYTDNFNNIAPHYDPLAIAATAGFWLGGGANSVVEISQNTISNIDMAIFAGNIDAKLKCNDFQNNMVMLAAQTNCKINMSSDLDAGFNKASNSQRFAYFDEVYSFDANNGFNSFDISDASPCYTVTVFPNHIIKKVCPIITSGSLISFTSYNSVDQYYENLAENNYWLPGGGNIEEAYNKIFKFNSNITPIINARMVTDNALTSTALVTCPGGVGCTGPACRTNTNIHPLNDNSNSSIIHTPSFVNKRLQTAVKHSLTKMDQMQNALLVNEAANLFTEILKENYTMPVKNRDDKYLLDLAYQKLFACIAQLTEWQRDSTSNTTPMPNALQNRFNDLHTINALRISRKDITEPDSKEMNDLVYLDKAMTYRLQENRTGAIQELNTILASQPKAEHRPLYENLLCVWSTEDEAIKNTISVDEALSRINECNRLHSPIKKANSAVGQRTTKPSPDNKTVYANNYTIDVYPNPTLGNLTISYSLQEFSKISFDLFDVQGKKMFSSILNPEEHNLNIDNLNLENGVYFYSITGDGKNLMTKKLVVVK